MVAFEPIERARPVAGDGAEFQYRLPGPGRRGAVLRRLLGVDFRGVSVVAAPRLDEQAVQAEQLGVVAARHRLEGARGA